jgi:hypothetical protein
MIAYDITASDFKKRYDNEDIVCLLAQMLAQNSFGVGFDLSHKKPVIIIRFIQRAEELIAKLDKHNLEIIKRKDLQNE